MGMLIYVVSQKFLDMIHWTKDGHSFDIFSRVEIPSHHLKKQISQQHIKTMSELDSVGREKPLVVPPYTSAVAVLEPALPPTGYTPASRAHVSELRTQRIHRRKEYWLRGDGARLLLQKMADVMNASPHLKSQPFNLALTDEMQLAISARCDTYFQVDEKPFFDVMITFADNMAQRLLSNFVRQRRWLLYDSVNQRPEGFSNPTFVGGTSSRAGPFNLEPGRLSEDVASSEYKRFMLENGLIPNVPTY
jgi:hypothetical protein